MNNLNGGRWNFSCAQPKLFTSSTFHGGAGYSLNLAFAAYKWVLAASCNQTEKVTFEVFWGEINTSQFQLTLRKLNILFWGELVFLNITDNYIHI